MNSNMKTNWKQAIRATAIQALQQELEALERGDIYEDANEDEVESMRQEMLMIIDRIERI